MAAPKSELIQELKAQLEDHDRLVIRLEDHEAGENVELLIYDVQYDSHDDVIEVMVERDA